MGYRVLARLIDKLTHRVWGRTPTLQCGDNIGIVPQLAKGRLIDRLGHRIYGIVLECCSAWSDRRVEMDCWDGGIADKIILRFTDNVNCLSAQCKKATLTYNDDMGTWTGSLTLRNGTLDFTLTCDPLAAPDAPRKFILSWTGCATGNSAVGTADCTRPLIIRFDQISDTKVCCACLGADDTAAINITSAETNCSRIRLAHLVDRIAGGPNIGKRVYAIAEDCYGGVDCEPCGCDLMTCQVTAVISGGSAGCAFLNGTYDFPRAFPANLVWELALAPALITMSCTDNNDGTLTLAITVTCGGTNTGSGSVTIDCQDLEDLDATITVTMVDPGVGGCAGKCKYLWNAMSVVWEYLSDTCTGLTCDPCPNSPHDITPPGPGITTREDDCPTSYTAPCCIGAFQVRVMRQP